MTTREVAKTSNAPPGFVHNVVSCHRRLGRVTNPQNKLGSSLKFGGGEGAGREDASEPQTVAHGAVDARGGIGHAIAV